MKRGFPHLNTMQAATILQVRQGAAVLDQSPAVFEALFDHFCDNGEMPYSVASRGDPCQWLESRVKNMSAREYLQFVFDVLN